MKESLNSVSRFSLARSCLDEEVPLKPRKKKQDLMTRQSPAQPGQTLARARAS